MSFQELLDTAKDLPLDLKLELLEALNSSIQLPVDPDIEEAWNAEIDKRVSEIDSGKVDSVSLHTLNERLRKKAEGWK